MTDNRPRTPPPETGLPEYPREQTFFEVFADVHTPPQCLPPVRLPRLPMPNELSGMYMREAFRKAIRALGLEGAVPPERLTFSGGAPSPEVFRQYEKVLPNATDRILAIAEKELDRRAVRQAAAFKADRRMINAAFCAGLGLLAAAAVAVWLGNAYAALALGLAGPLCAIFHPLTRRR